MQPDAPEPQETGIRPVEKIEDEVLRFLMDGKSTYRGDPEWVTNFDEEFTTCLHNMRVFNYEVRMYEREDGGFRFVYKLTNVSKLIH